MPVTICARTEAELEAAAEEIKRDARAEVLPVQADLSSVEGIQSVVSATVEHFGGLDILVSNSGGPAPGKFPDLTDDAWRQAFEVVTLNFVRFVREVLPHMRQKRWGRIIGIQSSSVKQPVEYLDLSNGIRPGIAGLMKAIMPDLAKDAITINLVLPGMFLTSRINPALVSASVQERKLAEEQLAPLPLKSRWAASASRSSSVTSSRSWPPSRPLRTYPGWVAVRVARWAFLNAIRPLASWSRARWFSSFLDQRMRMARLRFSQECVASTTHRRARQPGVRALSLISSPRVRMCGV